MAVTNQVVVVGAGGITQNGIAVPPGSILAMWQVDTALVAPPAGCLFQPAPNDGSHINVWSPPVPVPTTIAPLAFIQRLTGDERTAIRAIPALADFLDFVEAAVIVDVTDPLTTSAISGIVAYGALTAQRAAQVLDLSRTSP